MYYKDEDLNRRDEDNRRIYLRREFDDDGFHFNEDVVSTKPRQGLVLDDCVFDYRNKKKACMSKMAFAQNIIKKSAGFEDIDFEPFRPLFDMLQVIYDKAYK